MPYQFPSDVDEFVRQQMASGKYASEDDLLRDALDALRREDEDWKAIQLALEDFESGDQGIPLDVAFDVLRAKHGLNPNG